MLGKIGRAALGFTLIELMIVVAIIALVTAATVPSFSRALLQNRQRQAGATIVEAVLGARSLAARTGRCYQVQVWPSTPSAAGGCGGTVAVNSSNSFNCSQANALGAWNRVSIKAIGRGCPDPLGFAGRALEETVGDDVAIMAAWTFNNGLWFMSVIPGGFDQMLFEPTGELFNLQGHSYQVQMFLPDGTPLLGANDMRFVNVMSGGSVSYSTTKR